jgi:hypothetical protein
MSQILSLCSWGAIAVLPMSCLQSPKGSSSPLKSTAIPLTRTAVLFLICPMFLPLQIHPGTLQRIMLCSDLNVLLVVIAPPVALCAHCPSIEEQLERFFCLRFSLEPRVLLEMPQLHQLVLKTSRMASPFQCLRTGPSRYHSSHTTASGMHQDFRLSFELFFILMLRASQSPRGDNTSPELSQMKTG